MPAPITTLRSTIAAALADASYSTLDFPPATVLANSVIVSPADPYLTPSNNSHAGISPLANFRIIVTIPMFDNNGGLNSIETNFCTVFNKLAASSIVFNVTAVSAPSVLTVASGDLLTVDLQISVLSSWT